MPQNHSKVVPKGKIISGKINATETGNIDTNSQTFHLPTIP